MCILIGNVKQKQIKNEIVVDIFISPRHSSIDSKNPSSSSSTQYYSSMSVSSEQFPPTSIYLNVIMSKKVITTSTCRSISEMKLMNTAFLKARMWGFIPRQMNRMTKISFSANAIVSPTKFCYSLAKIMIRRVRHSMPVMMPMIQTPIHNGSTRQHNSFLTNSNLPILFQF